MLTGQYRGWKRRGSRKAKFGNKFKALCLIKLLDAETRQGEGKGAEKCPMVEYLSDENRTPLSWSAEKAELVYLSRDAATVDRSKVSAGPGRTRWGRHDACGPRRTAPSGREPP